MFKITNENINDLESLNLVLLEDPTVGGIVYFQGLVRNHNEGKEVKSLEYESYIPMAEKVGFDIVKEALHKFEIVDALCLHRVGHLAINDTAVWVIATGHHRREAFEASQYIIDTVKNEVPIWKREHYLSEDPQWVACHRCADPGHHHHGPGGCHG